MLKPAAKSPHIQPCTHREEEVQVQAVWVLLMRRYIISGNWAPEISQYPLSSAWCFPVQLQVSLLVLADTCGSLCLLKFNFTWLFHVSFYLFKKWTFVKLQKILYLLYIKVYFKLHLCNHLKMMESIIDFLLFFVNQVRGLPSTQDIFQLFTLLLQNFKSFYILHLVNSPQTGTLRFTGRAVDKDRTAFEQSKC